MDLTKFTSQIFKCELPLLITKYFQPYHVKNDGDCLFSCIGLAVEKTADTVRKEICKYMYDNIETFFTNEYIFQGVEHIDVYRYIQVMQLSGTWGTNIEICAAMLLYNRPIHVYERSGKLWSEIEYFIDNNKQIHENEIFLIHCSSYIHARGTHYELLKPIYQDSPNRLYRELQIPSDIDRTAFDISQLDLKSTASPSTDLTQAKSNMYKINHYTKLIAKYCDINHPQFKQIEKIRRNIESSNDDTIDINLFKQYLDDLHIGKYPSYAELLRIEEIQDRREEAQRQEEQRGEAQRRDRREEQRGEEQRREAQRIEAQRRDAQRQEEQRREAQRIEAQRIELQRIEAQRRDAQRQEEQRRESQRGEAQRQEEQRQKARRREEQRQYIQKKNAVNISEIEHYVKLIIKLHKVGPGQKMIINDLMNTIKQSDEVMDVSAFRSKLIEIGYDKLKSYAELLEMNYRQ